MILFNKFLMRSDAFPFPVALTSLHMVCSFSLALCLQRVCPALFPSVAQVFGKKTEVGSISQMIQPFLPFAPIALCGVVCLVCGNSAYRYASVSFLQMVKES